MTGLVQLSAVNSGDDVAHRLVTVTINGSTTPIVFDDISGTATFACNPGDEMSITDADSNAAGTSLPSPPFTTTAPGPAERAGHADRAGRDVPAVTTDTLVMLALLLIATGAGLAWWRTRE